MIEKVIENNINAEILDNEENTNDCIIYRDKDGKIINYTIKSFKKNREPFIRTLSRNEVDTILSMYSIYGENCSKAKISAEFADLTTHDIGRIIKCLGRYKYDSIFSPHQLEECSDSKLEEYSFKILEKKQLKKLEQNQQRAKEKVYQETYEELQKYKNLENIAANLKIDLSDAPKLEKPNYGKQNRSINIYLSDMHIGARCESHPLYENDYNKEEVYRRLQHHLEMLDELGPMDTINLDMLGDQIDGMDNQTARRDHIMPQNMDNMEQFDTFVSVMTWYIRELYKRCNHLNVHCVPCGNHGGSSEYFMNTTLQQFVLRELNDINFIVSPNYRDYYEFNDHIFILEHGKDEKFHKKGLPLNLNEKTKVFLFEWLRYKGLAECQNIHFIKGDLHSNNLNSCEAFTYRNVLSLFGASDYSNMNFSRNSYGISYDLFIGKQMISGTFENL